MSLSNSFNKLFIEPDEMSNDWDNKIFKYHELGDYKKLEEHIETAKELYLDERQICTAINAFTLKTESRNEKIRLLKGLKKADFVKDLKATESSLIIRLKNGEIRAYKLTGIIPALKKEDEDIETERRIGKCHEKSIKISNSMEIPNEVVTGFVFGYSDKSKYLHSWVELNYEGNDMVIDYTLNVFMNKEGYYLMQHAIPLSRISNKNIKNDLKIFNKFDGLGNFNIKEYLLFRDELIKDIEKNKDIFEEER